jgi:hypothetical protein
VTRAAAAAVALFAASAAAQTLPQGHGRVTIGFLWIHQQLPSLDVPRLLDTATAQRLVDALSAKGLLSATPDLGGRNLSLLTPGVQFSGAADVTATVPQIDYGLTDRISLSVIWPYFDFARTRVDLQGSHSLLAYNPAYDPRQPISLANLPIAAGFRGVTGTAGLQLLLANYFGYRPFTTWQSYGTGDPIVAVSHGLGGEPYFLRTTALVQVPLGRVSDPDNPIGIAFSDGHAKAGLRLWFEDKESPPLAFNAGFNWTYHFRDHPTLRIYPFALLPIATAADKERVTRTQGQQFEAVVGMSRSFVDGFFKLGFLLGLQSDLHDAIRGSQAADAYAPLISNTGKMAFNGELRLEFSTLEAFLRKSFAVPFQVVVGVKTVVVDRGLFAGIPQIQASSTLSSFF